MAVERVTGYPVDRFTNPHLISEEFICSICHEILREPKMVTPCQHIFCRTCIEQWIQTEEEDESEDDDEDGGGGGAGGSCPIDRTQVVFLQEPIRPFMNMLNALEIRCQYRARGCTATPKLGDLADHEGPCHFSPNHRSGCPGACGAVLTQAELQAHNCVAYLKRINLDLLNRLDEAQDREQEARDQVQEREEEIRGLRGELEAAREQLCLREEELEVLRHQVRDLEQPSTSAAARARASSSGAQTARRGRGRGGGRGGKPCPARFKTTSPYPTPTRVLRSMHARTSTPPTTGQTQELIAPHQDLSHEHSAITPMNVEPRPSSPAASPQDSGAMIRVRSTSTTLRISTRLNLDIEPGIIRSEIRSTNASQVREHLPIAIRTVAMALAPGHQIRSRQELYDLEERIEDDLQEEIGAGMGDSLFWHVVIGRRAVEGEGQQGGSFLRASTGMRETARDVARWQPTQPQEIARFELHVRDLEILITLMDRN